MTSASESNYGIVKTGNLKFCQYCNNLMNALSENNQLIWKCSIECQQSIDKLSEFVESGLVVLSRTDDDDMNIHLNPHNQYTIHDPTLLRCRRVCINADKHSDKNYSDGTSEMIIFKQNIATSNSYYICTICQTNNQI